MNTSNQNEIARGTPYNHSEASLALRSSSEIQLVCQYKMYESRVVTDEVEERRKLTNKLYEN